MAVFRVEKTRDYTVMSNYHLKDRSLSLKSKGLLSMMLSLPDEWNYTIRGLAAICKEGVDAIGASLKELEAAGYLVRNRLRDEHGRITDTEYVIYEKPQKPPEQDNPNTAPPCPAPPYTEKPDIVKQDMVSPCTDLTAQYNTYQVAPKKSKTHEENNHGSSIHPINPQGASMPNQPSRNPADEMDTMRAYRALIMENIEYDTLCERYGKERTEEVLELVLETVCSKREYIRIAGDEFPREVVKSRLLKLGQFEVEYVFKCLDKNTTKVRNIRAYLLTSLYNAPTTMDSYYRAEVNHDLYSS